VLGEFVGSGVFLQFGPVAGLCFFFLMFLYWRMCARVFVCG